MPTPERREPRAQAEANDAEQAQTAETYALMRRAIEGRLQVIATYDGHRRGLCPHLLGTTNDRAQALCYQFSGTSRSVDVVEPGLDDNWRCIPLAGLSDVTLREGPWHSAENYAPTQTCVAKVDVAVAGIAEDTSDGDASDTDEPA